jgi:hypothetical protein
MLEVKELGKLMKIVANADRSAPVAYNYGNDTFSYEELSDTLRDELNEYVGTPQLYRENKNLVFSLIEETIDEVLPKTVSAKYADFAEVRTFAQGDRPIFRRKLNNLSRARAKQFVTRVGLAGIYEVFKLGKNTESFEVRTSAVGAAAQIGFEEYLDGRVDFAELTQIVMEGIDELIFKEMGAALNASINQLPAANRVVSSGFDENAFDQLLIKAEAYGVPTIYCTYEFALKLVPQDAWRYTEAMKDELYRTGRLAGYKGHNVVILPQGFTDETMTTKAIDPSYCWIIPTGADTKPIKVAFEGGTLVKDDVDTNSDWSHDIHVYKKVGVVCMMSNAISVYRDTTLTTDATKWNLKDTVTNTVNA